MKYCKLLTSNCAFSHVHLSIVLVSFNCSVLFFENDWFASFCSVDVPPNDELFQILVQCNAPTMRLFYFVVLTTPESGNSLSCYGLLETTYTSFYSTFWEVFRFWSEIFNVEVTCSFLNHGKPKSFPNDIKLSKAAHKVNFVLQISNLVL